MISTPLTLRIRKDSIHTPMYNDNVIFYQNI